MPPEEGEGERTRTILLLGAGELGKEIAIAAQRLGTRVIAVDRYDDAPAMQVAHASEVVSMFDAAAVEGVIRSYRPDFVVPETEAIRADRLPRLEGEGYAIVPTAEAVELVVGREGLRRLAATELGLPTPDYRMAASEEELLTACDEIGYPCVVKPVAGYSGRGHSVVRGPARVPVAWEFARDAGPGEPVRVIAEELVEFRSELTILVVRERDGTLGFLEPIGHRQGRGGYQESWTPAEVSEAQAEAARSMAGALADRLGGAGVYGAKFFVTDDAVLFSDCSPGPHDTGLVTLASHDLSQFDLHVRAILGLPVPSVRFHGPTASAVILARGEGRVRAIEGVERALRLDSTEVRLFGKPEAFPGRRMGVVLARGKDVEEARARALEAAGRIEVKVD